MRDPAAAAAMGARARQRVVEKFSLDAEAGAIASVYRNLLIPTPLEGQGGR
jgi:mannosyltransferase